MSTVNTTHGYADDPAEREAIRSGNVARALARAEDEARRLGHSIKCGNWTPGSEEYHHPKHQADPGGCANDGRTCLCACHDGQRAWKLVAPGGPESETA